MANNDNEKIILLRNEASLCLDDLAALVVNGALAQNLRDFSNEVMDLRPGLMFTQRKAQKLKDLAQRTLRQYQIQAISAGDLMNYISDSRKILQNEDTENGGAIKVWIQNICKPREKKAQESVKQMEAAYKKICDQMVACEKKKQQCVENCSGQAPASTVYRNNEREYNAADNQLKLLKQQADELGKALDNATRVRLLREFEKETKKIADWTKDAIGSDKERDRIAAGAELASEELRGSNENMIGFGDSIFNAEVSGSISNSEFGALVAANERRQDIINETGQTVGNSQSRPAETLSEFDRLVMQAGSNGEKG